MKFTINIQKSHFYVLVALLVLAIGVVGVTAYGGNNPLNMGHSAGEIHVVVGGQTKTLQEFADVVGAPHQLQLSVVTVTPTGSDPAHESFFARCPAGTVRVGCSAITHDGSQGSDFDGVRPLPSPDQGCTVNMVGITGYGGVKALQSREIHAYCLNIG